MVGSCVTHDNHRCVNGNEDHDVESRCEFCNGMHVDGQDGSCHHHSSDNDRPMRRFIGWIQVFKF